MKHVETVEKQAMPTTDGKKLQIIYQLKYTVFVYPIVIHLVLAHLFVKVPRPGDSEGAFSVFESSCHLLLPV